MSIFKENPFGHILFLKKFLIRFLGLVTHARYKRFNTLEIEGSEVIRSLPDKNVLFVSNHQT
ncbi:MAG: 1-acyl-sn-glycerol-3-phosphate acyltransferase, partial [Aurantibacter sp.]